MAKRHIKIALITLFFLVGLISLSFIKTFAQSEFSSQSLEVTPPSQEISVDPGQTTEIKAKIRNPGKSSVPVKVRIEDFTATGDEGQVALIDKGAYAISNWTTISPTSFTLSPGDEKEVIATITIPKTGTAGGRYGSFVFTALSEKKESGTGAALGQEIASLFLLRISGPVSERLSLQEFTAPQFSEFGPIPFQLKFANSGNVHVKTFGLVNVSNMWGQKVADIVVPGTNVFPGANRTIEAQLGSRFLLGNYTATALMYYGTKNESLTKVAHFTVFPVRIAIVIAAVLFILFLLRKRFSKALKALLK